MADLTKVGPLTPHCHDAVRMGIYDRDYYRAEEPSGFLSGKSMVVNVIIATSIVFVLDIFSDHKLYRWLVLPSNALSTPAGNLAVVNLRLRA